MGGTLSDFLRADDDVATWQEMSDEDLIASVTTSVTTDPVVSDAEDDVEPPLTSSYH